MPTKASSLQNNNHVVKLSPHMVALKTHMATPANQIMGLDKTLLIILLGLTSNPILRKLIDY